MPGDHNLTSRQGGPLSKGGQVARRKRFQTGQLYKRGKRRKVWYGRWYENALQADGTVRQIRRAVILGTVADIPTKREAQTRLDEFIKPVNQGTSRPGAFVTVQTFIDTQWTPLVFPTFKRSTQHGYKTVLAKHVLPEWKDWRLRDIDRLAIQRWVADKFRQQTGWQSVRNAWVLLSGILESAVEYGYLEANPARGIKFPPKARKAKPAMIAGDSLSKLLKQLDQPYRTMVQIIAATGLRVGELLALRWGALDLDIGTLAVRESVYEGQHQGPKTERARRTIPLGSHAVAALTAQRERTPKHDAEDLVFANRKGLPFRESKLLTRVLQPAAEAAGLGRVTWHQFRHIHSSLLNDLKVPAKIAQEQLGHASISTTLGIYTHVVDASHRSAVEAVEDRLFGESDANGRNFAKTPDAAISASASRN
jgi:integrase